MWCISFSYGAGRQEAEAKLQAALGQVVDLQQVRPVFFCDFCQLRLPVVGCWAVSALPLRAASCQPNRCRNVVCISVRRPLLRQAPLAFRVYILVHKQELAAAQLESAAARQASRQTAGAADADHCKAEAGTAPGKLKTCSS